MTAVWLLLSVAAIAAPTITLNSPQNGWTVDSPIYFAASAASPTCVKGIDAMRIYAAPHAAVFSIEAARFETFVNLKPGKYDAVVQAWDNCGEAAQVAVKITVLSGGGVTVYSPANHATGTSPVRFVASASSPGCAAGIAAIRVYTAPGVEAQTVTANHLDATLALAPGTYDTAVQAWDNCGHVFKVPISTTVQPPNTPPSGRVSSF